MSEAKEELDGSVREGRIESRHSVKSLEGLRSRSHDLGAELRMHSLIITMVIFKCYFSGEHIALSTTKTKQQQRCENRIRKNQQIKSTVHDAN